MTHNRNKESEIPIYAFITFWLTRSYAVMAILQKKGYVDDVSANYNVEDFLWSGSGDGENETDVLAEEEVWWQFTTTVIQTTTVMWTSTATVYRNKPLQTAIVITTPKNDDKSNNCSEDTECKIKPTPARQPTVNTIISPWPPPIQTELPFADQLPPDPRYWLLTVLKTNNVSSVQFVPVELQRHLANLYQLAFRRHQEQHLGVNEGWQNKARLRSRYVFRKRRDNRNQVTVRLHNVTSDHVLRIVYSVSVSGHPVLATTAARDMNYVSDAEVVAELGYPVLTKAEPFLKSNDPASEQIVPGVPWRTKNSLLAASVTAVAALIFCLLVFVLVKNCKKKPNKKVPMENDERRPQTSSRRPTSRPEKGTEDENNGDTVRKLKRRRSRDKPSEGEPAAESSDDESPSDIQLRAGSSSRPVASPHSYLSMPSVKEFPTTPLPESLATVLNHTSRQNSAGEREENPIIGAKFSRHGSIGDDDPGVIGPVVWQTFRHQRDDELDNLGAPAAAACVVGGNSPGEGVDIDLKDVRKRFDRLLDEALSLRSCEEFAGEQDQLSSRRTITERYESSSSKSIIRNRESIKAQPDSARAPLRPRTSLNGSHRRHDCDLKVGTGMGRVRNAWCSNVASTPIRTHSRPLSAGPFHRPTVHPEFILTDSLLAPDDPAAPIISAIKRELDKIPKYESKHVQRRSTKLQSTHRQG